MKRRGVWLIGLSLVLVLGWGMIWAQQPTTTTPTGETVAKPKESRASLWYLYKASSYEGYTITACSIWMIATILANLMVLKHNRLVPPELVEQTDNFLRQKQAKAALDLCQQSDSLVGKMMSAGISRVGRGYQAALDYLAEVGQEEVMKLNQKLSPLSVIGAVAPMLGLLGTVRGMIQAFAQIAMSPTQPSAAELSGNIQLALVTTFEGLVVAIPSLFAYSMFKNHLARIVTESDMVVGEMMSRFQGITTPLTRIAALVAAGQAAPAEPTAEEPGGENQTKGGPQTQ